MSSEMSDIVENFETPIQKNNEVVEKLDVSTQQLPELAKPVLESETVDKLEISNNIKNEIENPKHLIQKKIAKLSIPTLESVTKEHIENFKFFNERHYEDYYFTSCNKHGQYDDMCIRVHTNKLLLLTLARGNDIIQSGKNIAEIDFVINKGDRSKVKVKGKRKYGARQVYPETIMCKLKLEGEEELRNVRSGISGNLIEINELVKQNPNLLKVNPKCNGFLAIVMPKGPFQETNILINNQHLIKEEKYLELLKERVK